MIETCASKRRFDALWSVIGEQLEVTLCPPRDFIEKDT
jgi:hypothetical protein